MSDIGFDDVGPARVVQPGEQQRSEHQQHGHHQQQHPVPIATNHALVEYDFGEDAGAGLEGMTAQEQLTPFLTLLQALSPQCVRGKPEYDPDARPGMMVNTATKELIDGDVGVEIIPVYREHMFGEWLPRDAGGGFRGTHPDSDPLIARLRQEQGAFKPLAWRNAENEDVHLVEQYNLGILYGSPTIGEDTVRRALLAFTSTKISVYRAWITRVVDIKYRDGSGVMRAPPLYAHRWRLRSVPQTNKKGDFFNFELNLAEKGPPPASLVKMADPLYLAAKEFHTMWRDGEVKADYASQAAAAGSVEGGVTDDEIPF